MPLPPGVPASPREGGQNPPPRNVLLSFTYDRAGNVLAQSVKTPDGYVRQYADRSLSQVVGYASFKYGASGVEAAYADSLIGQDPADPVAVWRARYLGERLEWMRRKLERAGQRSISALVDVTNYVMLELGRPLHVYDLDKLRGGTDSTRIISEERGGLSDLFRRHGCFWSG